jgi:hypothetical protein
MQLERAADDGTSLTFGYSGVLNVDLTHAISAGDVAGVSFAKGGGGGGPGGGGGGTTAFPNYISGPTTASAGFNIEIEFKGTWTTAYHDIFVAAANRLTALILGDVPNATIIGGKGKPTVVDDILISAEMTNIDGVGGILGQAGPTAIRTVGSLPAKAIMQFDIADADSYLSANLFDDIVLHEMSHSLGFGSIWNLVGVVQDGLFTGAAAVSQYVAMGGDAAGIPVEQDGGSGTAGSHWDEDTFGAELMTGYIDNPNYFTAMSAASFADIGYAITGNFTGIVDSGYVLA